MKQRTAAMCIIFFPLLILKKKIDQKYAVRAVPLVLNALCFSGIS